jgi:hypothetical protein
MRRSIYFITDQHKMITSGPGVFAGILKEFCVKKSINLKIICFEKGASWNLKILKLNKVKTFFIILLYSIRVTMISISHPKSVIFVNSFYHILFAIQIKRYTIFVNDIKFDKSNKLLRNRAIKILKSAKQIVANSDYVKEYLSSIGVNRCLVLNKSLDTTFSDAWKIQRNVLHPYNRPTLRILFIKNDWKIGGLEEVLADTLKIKKIAFHITVVGISKNDFTEVNNICSRYLKRDQFEIMSTVSRNEVKKICLNSDVLVNNCSVEAFCVSALEAAVCGCLVITRQFENGLNSLMKKYNFGYILQSEESFYSYFDRDQLFLDIVKAQKDREKITKNFNVNVMQDALVSLLDRS